MVHAEVVQPSQDVLGLVLLVQPRVDDRVAVFDLAPGERVDDLLLGALVDGEQPDEVLEQLPLRRALRALYLTEQAPDLVVLFE